MKRSSMLGLLLGTLILPGCVVGVRPQPYRTVAVVGPGPVMVEEHIHSPSCGHFHSYYDGYPVYYYGGGYQYWSNGMWVTMAAPPVVYRRHYHSYYPRGHAYYRSYAPQGTYPSQHRGPHHAVPLNH